MGFLSPTFLLGLLAVSVPVVIHLVHRERRQTMAFPSLMFLRRVPHRSVRRRRIRQWTLLALRGAALALLAVAFARPVLKAAHSATPTAGGPTARVLLIDRSYSMGYGDRWVQARAAAGRVLGEPGEDDLTGLVFFGDGASAAGPLTGDRASLETALGEAELGWGGTRYAPALKLGSRLLDESGLKRRELILVSDFQRRALDGLDEVQLGEGTDLRWVDLSEPETQNCGITEVTLQRVYDRGRERVAVAARVARRGGARPEPVSVTLELAGRVLDTEVLDLRAESAATVRFDPVSFPAGPQRARVRLEPDALPQDDVFRFVLAPGRKLGVLIVGRDRGRRRESLFLRHALAIGDRPSFDVRLRESSAFGPRDLAGASVVVLNDTAWPAGEAGESLRAFVAQGGGVVAALGARSVRSGGEAVAGLLPGAFEARVVDRSADWGGTLAFLDYEHPVFELFRRPRSGDFSNARFLRYRTLDAGAAAVLARFDDGGPALVETRLGEGRVLFWTSSLDTLWNDLPLQPVFLPFLHRLVAHAARYVEAPAWHRVGDVLELPALDEGRWVGLNPGAERALGDREGRFVELETAGFYELRPSGVDDPAAVLTAAVNVDPAESDLAAADPEELAGRLTRRANTASARGALLTREEREERQSAWWYLLLAALAVLAFETALSNRLSQAVR